VNTTTATSERILRSLVPEADWLTPTLFKIDTKEYGTWLIEVTDVGQVFKVVSDTPRGSRATCDCDDCKKHQAKLGGYAGRTTPRGIMIRDANIMHTEEAKWARALSLFLVFEFDPGYVPRTACG